MKKLLFSAAFILSLGFFTNTSAQSIVESYPVQAKAESYIPFETLVKQLNNDPNLQLQVYAQAQFDLLLQHGIDAKRIDLIPGDKALIQLIRLTDENNWVSRSRY